VSPSDGAGSSSARTSQAPFIGYSSNVFAILGLRALYFLLADVIHRFHYLKMGLSAVLVFVGAKMLMADVYHVPIGWSLAVIVAVLGIATTASLLWPRADIPEATSHGLLTRK
jgi:tellurite resistance protein TerC